MSSVQSDDGAIADNESIGKSSAICGHKALLFQMGCPSELTGEQHNESMETETEYCSSDSSPSDKGGGIWHWLCHPSVEDEASSQNEHAPDHNIDNEFYPETAQVSDASFKCSCCSCCSRNLVDLDACNNDDEESSISSVATPSRARQHDLGNSGTNDNDHGIEKVLVDL